MALDTLIKVLFVYQSYQLHCKQNKLTRLYTQNIDGLEAQCTNLPKSKVVPVHGSMDRVACENCNSEMNFEEFCSKVRSQIKDITEKDPLAPAQCKM